MRVLFFYIIAFIFRAVFPTLQKLRNETERNVSSWTLSHYSIVSFHDWCYFQTTFHKWWLFSCPGYVDRSGF